MKVLVDTSVWSLALRRNKKLESLQNSPVIYELKELINEARAVIIGPIRQEILSGIPDEKQFFLLKQKVQAFDDIKINQSDYELAAEFYNICRKKGIQGSQIDYLICAVANRLSYSIFTLDKDFEQYGKILDIKLHKPRKLNQIK